jgi:hypothetical protein
MMAAALAACGYAVPESPQPVIEAEYTAQLADVIEYTATEDAPIAAAVIAFEAYSRILDQLQTSYDVDFVTITDIYFDGEAITSIIEGNVNVTVDGDTVYTSLTVDMGELMEDLLGGILGSTAALHMVTVGNEVTSLRLLIGGWDVPLDMFAGIGDGLGMFDVDEIADILQFAELPDIDIDSILSVEIEEDRDTVTINMTIGGQATLDLAFSMIDDNIQDEDFILDLDDIQLTIVTDSDGNPLTVAMTMGMSYEFDGSVFRIKNSSEFIFNAVSEGSML